MLPDIENWSNMDVSMILVNSGEVWVVRDQSEWTKLINGIHGEEKKCLVVLDSNGKSVKKFDQSTINYLICKGKLEDKENSSSEVMRGLELFNEYVQYSIRKFENSRINLNSRLETLQKMNFKEKYHNFKLEQSLNVDFSKIVNEMQEKLRLVREKTRLIVVEMNSFLAPNLRKSIDGLSIQERIEYFDNLINNFTQIKKLFKNPFDDMTKRLFDELLLFDGFEPYYRLTLQECSRINNVKRELENYLQQAREEEQENQAQFKEFIGIEKFKYVLKIAPSIVDYISNETNSSMEDVVEMASSIQSVTNIQGENTLYSLEEEEMDEDQQLKDQEIQDLRSQIEGLNNRIAELNNQVNGCDVKNNSLIIGNVEFTKMFEKEMQDMTDKFNKEIECLKMEKEEIEKNMKEEKENMLQQLEIEKQQRQDYEKQIKALRDDVEYLKNEKKNENNKANKEITGLNEQLKTEKEQISKLMKQLSFLKEESETEEAKYNANIKEQKEKYQTLLTDLNEIQQKLESSKGECTAVKSQLEENAGKYCENISNLEGLIVMLKDEIRNDTQNYNEYQQKYFDSKILLESLEVKLSERVEELKKVYDINSNLEYQLGESNHEKEKLMEDFKILQDQLDMKLSMCVAENLNLEEKLKNLENEKEQLLISSFVDPPNQTDASNDKQKRLLESLANQLQLISFSLASVIQDRARWIDNVLEILTNLITGEIDNLDEDQLNDIVRGLCNRWHFARDKKLIDENGSDARGIGH
ncbi:hypothetical protein NAEGRDRAFT_80995 [Naegleria gruberi]|uniref:Uncharacterized protein n=1 Tax=Naegleria gruberi TaxID=5762 RepID=D2VRP3_NAEGR|nr:uncharacterized protein NAEGRDRAFT_80995 [Naegleria gruberi]EFC40427.1 hypothetical protein NAEGRDRAFT_80995 [Naegleria gruberi]|eukprot:XP_002673171.1 hypothetical protein NAEGRDRAFT_80995 [Naegleria gruberi strain NEG-M]